MFNVRSFTWFLSSDISQKSGSNVVLLQYHFIYIIFLLYKKQEDEWFIYFLQLV